MSRAREVAFRVIRSVEEDIANTKLAMDRSKGVIDSGSGCKGCARNKIEMLELKLAKLREVRSKYPGKCP